MSWPRRVGWRAAAGVLIAAGLLTAPSGISASVRRGAPAWHARIVVPGDFGGLIAADGSLYAVRYALHGPTPLNSRIVRVDPTTGRVLATSRILPGAGVPVVAAGRLWVEGVTWYSPRATSEGPAVLTELDPSTLAPVRQVLYRRGLTPELFAGAGLLMGSTWRAGATSCAVRWLNPDTGRAYRSALVTSTLGPCMGAAVDTSGRSLDVMVNGPSYHTTLYRLDSQTGAILASLRGLNQVVGGYGIVAAAGRIWVSAGTSGAAGSLYYYLASPLRLLAASCVDVCSARGRLPLFGQYPDAELSGGRVWVASYGELACFAPSSGRALALVQQERPPIVTNSLVEIDGKLWGNTDGQNPPSGLAILSPPRSCR